ncbi:MAG: hypothetical protein JWM10_571 [Myxococcaceae bacterium]|nr:hypothetical protein [Myxococcaceae bacterium]
MSARRWVFAAAVLVSCAVPELDTEGNIVCGATGTTPRCPEGYDCRLGRCCPSGSPLGACPVTQTGGIGAPCAAPACAASSTAAASCCATVNGRGRAVFPGGYTTLLGCATTAQCGSNGVCIDATALLQNPVCLRRCYLPTGSTYAPCRNAPSEGGAAGYVCVKDPDDRDANAGICIPDCTVVPDLCPGTCNVASHTCQSCSFNRALCVGTTVCRAGTCETVACGATNLNCPAGSFCSLAMRRCVSL